MKNKLEEFSDEELVQELDRRFKVRRGPIIGYRAICYGDDYKYGGYVDYTVNKFPKWSLERCKKASEDVVERSENGGRVEELYKDTPNPKDVGDGKIH